MKDIYKIDWFANRNELGKYHFDKSGAIFDFSSKTVSETLWGKQLKHIIEDPRYLEKELEGINIVITKNQYAKVILHKKDKSCYTDKRTITISGLPIIDYGQKGVDIVVGCLAHESSHIRYTDFFLVKEAAKKSAAVKWIWNTIEDEVIEEMLQIEKPGFGNVLGPIKDYMFGAESKPIFNDEIDEILYILFALIRYPKNLELVDKSVLDKHEKIFISIYNILKKNNVLNIDIKQNATQENYQAALDIYNFLVNQLQKNPSMMMSGWSGEGDGENSGEGSEDEKESKENSEENSDEGDGENSGEGSNERDSENSKEGSGDGSEEKSEKESDKNSGSGKPNQISKTEAKEFIDNKFDGEGNPESEAFDGLEGTMIGSSTGESTHPAKILEKMEEQSKYPIEPGDLQLSEEQEFDCICGISPTRFLKKIDYDIRRSDVLIYSKLRNQVTRYIKYVKDISIKESAIIHKLTKEEYRRNGSLDPRLLASAIQNVKNVYQRHGVKTIREQNKKFAVVLTLDESGSMGGKDTRETVSLIATIFAEAFKGDKNIELFVYGHSDYVVKYITPKSKDFYCLSNRYQGMGQNEVYAYNTIIKDVIRETDANILLVNITDAQYLANYSEIENELKKWDKKIYQSLIVINNNFTNSDSALNDRIYGKDKWARIPNFKNEETVKKELKKLVKAINELFAKHKK